jgi:predicted metal-dependent peptidase
MTEQTNPIYEERERGIAFMEIGIEILKNARNELYLAMRFLDVSLSSLAFVPEQQITLLGTDGSALYFQPDALVSCFRKGRVYVNRAYLHSILHCLFGHLWHRKDRDSEYWNLACDIAAEWVLDGLNVRAVHVPRSMFRRSVYRKIRGQYALGDPHRTSVKKGDADEPLPEDAASGFTVTAERIYSWLCQMHLPQPEIDRMVREFAVDDHRMWQQDKPSNRPQPEQQRWDDIRDRMQTEMETFSKEASDDVRSLTEQVEIENRERYDYREFLQKFAVLKEELQVDLDSFDYIFYHYGMSLYGNMPLIEPLETKEVRRVEDFVIVIDTSMSCKGELVRRFLEETCTILQESGSFSRRIHIRILQCDDRVQEDIKITNPKELRDYMSHFTVKGLGGTDFRPAFAYVEELKRQKVFTKLRGLIYFTDGYGTFPVKKPDYETAFVFLKEDYRDVDVPPWAIKLILEPEQIDHSIK